MIPVKAIFPIYIVADLKAASAFYAHFGFAEVFSGDWYIHLATETGAQLGFLLPQQPTQPPLLHAPFNGKGSVVSLEVDDADSAFLAAQAAGFAVVLATKSEDWGQRHFILRDPNGVLVDIVQSFTPSAEYAAQYVQPGS